MGKNIVHQRGSLSFWGQALMVGIPEPRVDAVARELIRDLGVGGVILFARNLETPEQVWELTRDLQRQALAAADLPLLIALDQEGGTVQRLREPFSRIPPAQELGERASPEEVRDLARRTARELALVGVNMNLAPVLDVARGSACPLWDRSYGSDPERVAEMGAAAIAGFLEGGVLPVAKHFPGLGDTLLDSHQALPTAGSSSREVDLLPFRRAIAAGVPAIMTAHVVAPEWDDRPATLSAKILQGLLRHELGFDGLIITDDLEMGAIAGQLTVPRAARGALAAGADCLLICNRWEAVWEAVERLRDDPALLTRVEDAARRLARLRNGVARNAVEFKEVRNYFKGRVW